MLGLGPNPFSYLLAGLYLPKRSIFKFQWKCRATARKKSPKIMDLGIFRHFNISETILTKLKKIEIFNKIRPFICLYLGTFILFLTIFKKIEENVPIFDRNRSILIEFLSILTKCRHFIAFLLEKLSKSIIFSWILRILFFFNEIFDFFSKLSLSRHFSPKLRQFWGKREKECRN